MDVISFSQGTSMFVFASVADIRGLFQLLVVFLNKIWTDSVALFTGAAAFLVAVEVIFTEI